MYLSKANNETRLGPKLRPALWEVGIQMPTLSARGKASIACNAGEARVGNSLQKLISRVITAFLWKNRRSKVPRTQPIVSADKQLYVRYIES